MKSGTCARSRKPGLIVYGEFSGAVDHGERIGIRHHQVADRPCRDILENTPIIILDCARPECQSGARAPFIGCSNTGAAIAGTAGARTVPDVGLGCRNFDQADSLRVVGIISAATCGLIWRRDHTAIQAWS